MRLRVTLDSGRTYTLVSVRAGSVAAAMWLVALASPQRGTLSRFDLFKVFFARATWGRPRTEPLEWMR